MCWRSQQTDSFKIPTALLLVKLNTTMELASLSELRDFFGADVGQSCGCETAQGNQHWGYGLLVWRRVVRPTQPKITGRGQGSGAVAICIDLSAGIRGGSSARCKVEISLTELHSAVSPGTDLSSFWRSAADSSWCTYRGYRRYTSGGAALLHLIHPICFQFYPFHHFSFSEMSPS